MSLTKTTYQIAKAVYDQKLSKPLGINKLVSEGMKRGSASIVIRHIFPRLMNGVKFKRTMAVADFDILLTYIIEDCGIDQLSISLNALRLHIDYCAERTFPQKLSKVYEKYLKYIPAKNKADEVEQTEIVSFYKGKTKEELKDELRNSKSNDGEIVIINRKTYKRDNKAIALIKILRGFKCQICGSFIVKKDGSQYIEAAHIIAKAEMGKEITENILLLCPNHHKEFDLGDRGTVSIIDNIAQFRLNGQTYAILLSVD